MKKKGIELKPENGGWIDKHGLHKHDITIKPKREKTEKVDKKWPQIVSLESVEFYSLEIKNE